MTHLLDVNVLIALHDAQHVHHELAHDWFRRRRAEGWATCPLTLNGCARVMSSPAYITIDATVGEILWRLRAFCAEPDHTFWPAAVDPTDGSLFRHELISSHAQLADVYLLGLALHRGGRLATFDRTIPWRAAAGAKASNLEVIGARPALPSASSNR